MPPVNEMLDHMAKARAIANALRGTVTEVDYVADELDELLEYARDNCFAVVMTEEDRQDMRDEKGLRGE